MDSLGTQFIVMACKTQLCDSDNDDACEQTGILIYIVSYIQQVIILTEFSGFMK